MMTKTDSQGEITSTVEVSRKYQQNRFQQNRISKIDRILKGENSQELYLIMNGRESYSLIHRKIKQLPER